MRGFVDVKSFYILSRSDHRIKLNVTCPPKMSFKHGFLPKEGPLLTLEGNDYFNNFVSFANNLPELLKTKKVCETLDTMDLPDFSPEHYPYGALVRVYAVATSLIHAYILESGGDPKTNTNPVILTKKLSEWFERISHQIGRLPTQTYETYILQNYRLLNKEVGYTFENIEPLITYTGTNEEKWFIKMHVYAEHRAATAMQSVEEINMLLGSKRKYNEDTQDRLIQHFDNISRTISTLNQSYFSEMKTHLPTDYFFDMLLRPFLQSWEPGVIYQGSSVYEKQKICWRGGSGAESSFIPAIDLVCQLKIEQQETMRDMENYMPPEHQVFLNRLRNCDSELRTCILDTGNERLIESYNKVANASHVFRRNHYAMFVEPYIVNNLVKVSAGKVMKSLLNMHVNLSDQSEITAIVSNLLKQFFTSYKKLMGKHHVEHLLKTESRSKLDAMMAQLKHALFSANPYIASSDSTSNFEKELLTSFTSIIQSSTSHLNHHSTDYKTILEKTFDQFDELSNRCLGTGGEDFSLFLQKNMSDSKNSALTKSPSTLFAAVRNHPFACTLVVAGFFAAGATILQQYGNTQSPLKFTPT